MTGWYKSTVLIILPVPLQTSSKAIAAPTGLTFFYFFIFCFVHFLVFFLLLRAMLQKGCGRKQYPRGGVGWGRVCSGEENVMELLMARELIMLACA